MDYNKNIDYSYSSAVVIQREFNKVQSSLNLQRFRNNWANSNTKKPSHNMTSSH